MADTGSTAIVKRWAIAGWVLNSLLVAAGIAVMFISEAPPWIVAAGTVAAIVLLNVGRWVALQRALERASHPRR